MSMRGLPRRCLLAGSLLLPAFCVRAQPAPVFSAREAHDAMRAGKLLLVDIRSADEQDALRQGGLMGLAGRQRRRRLSENKRGREHEAPGQNDPARCGAFGHDAQRSSAQKRWMRRQASSSFSSEVA